MTAEKALKLTGFESVLFDLDGTLADTAPDLAFALNETLTHFNREPLPFNKIRPFVTFGGAALVSLGFNLQPEDTDFGIYREYLLKIYQDNICKETDLFDGMHEVLTSLEEKQISWGVVTNKPSWLTDPLMDAMRLTDRAACIVSGDTCKNRKPHPEPILHACKLANANPEKTIYVGDALRDMQAGNAAGCTTVAALFGYLNEDDTPENWNADISINHASELLDLIE